MMIDYIKVNYYKSGDSEPEPCEYDEIITGEDVCCNFCDEIIKEGEEAILLCSDDNIYVLHKECADKSTQRV